MRKSTIVKIILAIILIVPVFSFIHYWTPRTVVIRMTDTNVIRVDTNGAAADVPGSSKDMYEIYGESIDRENTYEFENEDNGLYLKFDSTKLQSQAAAIANSSDEAERIAAVTYIGWRVPIFSMFPNALKVERVDPSYTAFPTLVFVFWGIILTLVGGAWLAVSRWKARRKAKAAAAALAREEAERARLEAANRPTISDTDAADRFINGN